MLRFRLFCLAATAVASGLHAQTPTLTTLADFNGVVSTPNSIKGSGPRGGLVFGNDGQLYGTTELGGSNANATNGNGVIYKITTDGSSFTSLLDFGGASDGSRPTAGLLRASDGNFYGTASNGGVDALGAIFQLTPGGVLSTYAFRTATQKDTGAKPTDSLIDGGDGFLYGTTSEGGLSNCGTIFKMQLGAPSTPIRIIDFSGTTNGTKRGSLPSALVKAADGNFYGTTQGGGLYGFGTVFKLTATGVFTVLTDFGSVKTTYTGPKAPRGALVQVKNGLLYGVSAAGGSSALGTVFSVNTAGTFTVLVHFTGEIGSKPGSTPDASLTLATDGFLYGTTLLGGTSRCGTIFRVSTGGTFKNLIQFTGGAPTFGSRPRGALLQDNDGNFYGTTSTSGANGLGTVFKLSGALPLKATVSTQPVTAIFGTRATLAGKINPQGTTALYWFEYGQTPFVYGGPPPPGSKAAPVNPVSAGSGKVDVSVATPISGLTPSTTYHYRIVVTNGGGTEWGLDQTFVTGPNPHIVTPPSDQLVGINAPASFNVSATGVALKYAWLKTGNATVLGSAASYTIAKASLASAGQYSVKVTDGGDTVQTPAVRLGVINTTNTESFVNEGAEITLKLSNAGPGLSFQWEKDGNPVTDDSRITGAQTSNLRITNANGGDTATYVCKVTLGAIEEPSGDFKLTTRLRPVMNIPALGPWTTNGQAYGSITAQTDPDSPVTKFTAAGLPAGVVLNATSGVLSGRPQAPGVYTAQFTATNLAGISVPLNYPITVEAASVNAAGSFAGVVNRHATDNNNLGGRFTLTLTNTGTGSGSLVHLGKTLNFTAKLDNIPGTTRTLSFTPAVASGFPAITGTLTEATGDIAGTVKGVPFTAKRNPGIPGAKAGVYNVVFSPKLADTGNAALPQGSGYGSMTISSTGVVTWTGKVTSDGVTSTDNKFGEGTSITGSSLLASDGSIPWHFPLYTVGTGSAQGWMSIDASNVVTEQSFDWIKGAQTTTTRSYKSGFALHNLEVDGGKYVKPAAGVNVLGLSGSTSNAQLVFSEGGLTSTITQLINLPNTNVPTVVLPNPNTVKLSFDLNTGHFYGSFVLPDPVPTNVRTVKFGGVLIPGLQQGIGQFQLPDLLPSPTTSPILSGRVVLGTPPS